MGMPACDSTQACCRHSGSQGRTRWAMKGSHQDWDGHWETGRQQICLGRIRQLPWKTPCFPRESRLVASKASCWWRRHSMGVREEGPSPQLHRLAPLCITTLFSRASLGFNMQWPHMSQNQQLLSPHLVAVTRGPACIPGAAELPDSSRASPALVCAAHCTLLGACLHSDGSVCWIFVEPSTCFS